MNKLLLTSLVSVLCVLPAAAQTQDAPRAKANQSLETQVERAVAQASTKQPKQGCTCVTKTELVDDEPLSLEELIAAEEELSSIRNQDIHATFEKYPYLLDPAYRRKGSQNNKPSTCTCVTQEQEPLSPAEMIEAEEELALLRNRQDPNATFEKYPYLLQPQYRRANQQTQQSMRRQYTQSTWARKVGI